MSKTILHALTVLSSLTFAITGCGAEPVDGADVEVVHGAICASNQLTPAAATSSGTPKRAPGLAIDGSITTRWESAYSDPQWLVVDLGAIKTVNHVQIDWETANASNYRIDVSSDNTSWSAVVDKAGMSTGDHRLDDWSGFSVAARYVRMFGTRRNTQYGYSIWEMRVFGDGSATCGDGANLATAGWTSSREDRECQPGATPPRRQRRPRRMRRRRVEVLERRPQALLIVDLHHRAQPL